MLRLLGLQLVNGLQQALNLIAAFVEVVGQLGGALVAAVDLGLQVFERAVVGAGAALVGGVRRLEGFELSFELQNRKGKGLVDGYSV